MLFLVILVVKMSVAFRKPTDPISTVCGAWTTAEKLLLVSVLDRYGSNDWKQIERMMRYHMFDDDTIKEPRLPEFYASKWCAAQFTALLEEFECGQSSSSSDSTNQRRGGASRGQSSTKRSDSAELTKQMISHLTMQYSAELRAHNDAEEKQIRQLMADLAAVESGQLSDEQLQQMLDEDNEDSDELEEEHLTVYEEALMQNWQAVKDGFPKPVPPVQPTTPTKPTTRRSRVTSPTTVTPTKRTARKTSTTTADEQEEEEDERSLASIANSRKTRDEPSTPTRSRGRQPLSLDVDQTDSKERDTAVVATRSSPRKSQQTPIVDVADTVERRSTRSKGSSDLASPVKSDSTPTTRRSSRSSAGGGSTTPVVAPAVVTTPNAVSLTATDVPSADNEKQKASRSSKQSSPAAELKEQFLAVERPPSPSPSTVSSTTKPTPRSSRATSPVTLSLPSASLAGSVTAEESTKTLLPTTCRRRKRRSNEMFLDEKQIKHRLSSAIQIVSGHRHANLFLKPVNSKVAPGYYDKVKRPRDLTSLRNEVEKGTIGRRIELERDLYLMFANAVMYNSTAHEVNTVAKEMAAEVMPSVKELMDLNGDPVTDLLKTRRGTRHSHHSTEPPMTRSTRHSAARGE